MSVYTANTTTGSSYTLYLEVEETSYSISNNTSNIRFRGYVVGASGTTSYGDALTLSLTVNGTTKTRTTRYNFSNVKTYYCNPTGTSTSVSSGSSDWYTLSDIQHNNDGTKSISVKFTASGGSLFGSGTIDTTFSLSPIPRASSVSFRDSSYLINNSNLSNNDYTVVTITKASTSFYHKLTYTISTTTISEVNIGQDSSSTTTNNLPFSTIVDKWSFTNNPTLVVTCNTYSDSNYSVFIGTSSRSVPISIKTEATISSTLTTSNWTSSKTINSLNIDNLTNTSFGVAGYSSLTSNTFTITAPAGTTSLNADIPTFSRSGISGTITKVGSPSGISYTFRITTSTLPVSSSWYTSDVYVVFSDSRQNSVRLRIGTLGVCGYQTPYVKINDAYRVQGETGDTIDGAGGYFYTKVTYYPGVIKYDSSNRVYHTNTSSYSGTYKTGSTTTNLWDSESRAAGAGDGNFSVKLGTSNNKNIRLPITNTAILTFSITDGYTGYVLTPAVTGNILTARFPLDLYDNGSGTVGVGLGTIAEAGVIIAGLPINSTGSINSIGDINLITNSSSSDDSADLVWKYGDGTEKMRIYAPNTPTAKQGPNFRIRDKSASTSTFLYSGTLPLADGTGASGTWGINISGNAAKDGNGNTITSTYLKLSGGQITNTGNITKNYYGTYQPRAWCQGTSTTANGSATAGTFYYVPLQNTESDNPVIDSSNIKLYGKQNGGIKVFRAGKYRVSGAIYIGTGSGGRAGAYIYDSNNQAFNSSTSTELIGNALYGNGTDVVVTIPPRIITMEANHIIHLVARVMTAAGTIYYSNKSTYLLVEWVSD